MKNSRLVYSTDNGRIKTPSRPAGSNSTVANHKSSDGTVRIHRETKGRKGKGVSLIKGLILETDALKKIAKILKQKAGVGGTVKDGVIEIQTDNREQLKIELEKMGHSVKLAGS